MKKKAVIFICVALLVLMVVPAINFQLGNIENKSEEKWWHRSVLYNLDFALPSLGHLLYLIGISTNPNQVMIGKNGWLYLGDQYERTITVRRNGASADDAEAAKKIALAMKSWEQWLKHRGVRLYKIMLGPDKPTIYPEFLPGWARPAHDSATNMLLDKVSRNIYVDTRPALNAARSQFSEPLYYQTDTHWNSLGAWVAFRAFTMEIASTEREKLRWLSDKQIRILKVNERRGGDLANFLRIQELLRDSDVLIEIGSGRSIETEQYDFETGQLKVSSSNPQVDAPRRPLLVKSKNALNQKKVLWLRDSFGTAIAPFMAATFTETLQLHYDATDPALFSRLVDTYKPDYVFITVVERGARGEWFTRLPPTVFPSGKPKEFISLSQATLSGTNNMTKIEGTPIFRISGPDPFMTFTLPNLVRPQDVSKLVFDLDCGEKKESVHIQVFWHTASTAFSEASSIRFTANPGITSIDLSPISSWAQAGSVTDVRIDFDSPNTCPELAINSLALGR